MNLQKLFETQAILDNRIVEKHNLQGEDLLDKKILALQVELGELCNEWKGFKFWSENQEPRYEVKNTMECIDCYHMSDCTQCSNTGEIHDGTYKYPLLEEYVDCLHFILSIGNEFGYKDIKPVRLVSSKDNGMKAFREVFKLVADWDEFNLFNCSGLYQHTLNMFLHLGYQLGFTWEQIEQAYFDKNKVNHERQESGY